MMRFILIFGLLILAGYGLGAAIAFVTIPAPAKTETLRCVRVKQVTPAGAINYLCEVRK